MANSQDAVAELVLTSAPMRTLYSPTVKSAPARKPTPTLLLPDAAGLDSAQAPKAVLAPDGLCWRAA